VSSKSVHEQAVPATVAYATWAAVLFDPDRVTRTITLPAASLTV
jgi:hypothetical protein